MNVFSKEIELPPYIKSTTSSTKNQNIRKNSVGNQHTFPQQNHSKKGKSNISEDGFTHSEFYQDLVIEQVVEKLSTCCSKGTQHGFGCLLTLFRPNSKENFCAETFNEEYSDCSKKAIQYVKECRKLGFSDHPHKSQRESRDMFLQEVYRECFMEVQALANDKSKHVMRYCIPAINFKPGSIHKPVVCLQTLLGVYGFTEHDWHLCSKAFHDNPTGRVSSLRHKVWKDDKLPEVPYADIEKVFRDNLKITNAGKERT